MGSRTGAAAAMMVGGVFIAAGAVQASNGHGGEAFWAALLGGISFVAGVGLARGGRR